MFGMDFGLDRMQALMVELDSPQISYQSIHIVGTNGKSSTTQMVGELLREHDLSVGAYTSPHVEHFWERTYLDGQEIDQRLFAKAVSEVAAAVRRIETNCSQLGSITQFELLTATAFVAFRNAEVDVAVVEAGLGARHDATSVINPVVSVLTSVGLEHTELLGDSITKIATEKVAAVQEGAKLVVARDLHPDALTVAESHCQAVGAILVVAESQTQASKELSTPFQRHNFALAEAAAECIGEIKSSKSKLVARNLKIPGRFEQVSSSPLTVLDVAHNPAAVEQLIRGLKELGQFERRVAVVSILQDKSAELMLELLADYFDDLVLSEAKSERVVPARDLELLAKDFVRGELLVEPDIELACQRAKELAGSRGLVTVTGTNYLLAFFH